jgi:hypothetical protein
MFLLADLCGPVRSQDRLFPRSRPTSLRHSLSQGLF